MNTAVRAPFVLVLLLIQQAAAGATEFEELPVAGGVLLIDWRGDYSAAQRVKLRSWLDAVGETVTLLHGSLPRTPIRIELTAYSPAFSGANAAVPFGRVKRRDPQGVEFFVNPARPLDDFIGNWTAYHELSHLFIPYPGNADVWLSEGLASYYQNVLQFRGGLLTEQQTWQKLYDGFERGRNDDRHHGLTLGELSPRMREKRAFMRVYWSGALYFLEADLALRARSDGAMTLDTVIRDFGACCLERRRRWNGPAIAAEFDRLAAVDIFMLLYERYEKTTAIPDYLPPLDAAGVVVRNDTVEVAIPGFLMPQPHPDPKPKDPDRTGWNLHETKGWTYTKPFGEPVVVME